MKDTLKLIGPKGEGANVDAGSEAEKHYRGLGYATGEEIETAGKAAAAKAAQEAEDVGAAQGKDGKGVDKDHGTQGGRGDRKG